MTKLIRINQKTLDALERLSKETGFSKKTLLDEAIKKLAREKFLQQANEDYLKVRKSKKAWAALEKERALWESTLNDGLEND